MREPFLTFYALWLMASGWLKWQRVEFTSHLSMMKAHILFDCKKGS